MLRIIPQAVEWMPSIYHGNGYGLFGCDIVFFPAGELDFGIIYIVKVPVIMLLGKFRVGIKDFLKAQVQAVQYIIISRMVTI